MPSLETRLRPLLKAVGYFGADATRARTAHALFRACALQASHPNWAKRAGIDTRAFRPQAFGLEQLLEQSGRLFATKVKADAATATPGGCQRHG